MQIGFRLYTLVGFIEWNACGCKMSMLILQLAGPLFLLLRVFYLWMFYHLTGSTQCIWHVQEFEFPCHATHKKRWFSDDLFLFWSCDPKWNISTHSSGKLYALDLKPGFISQDFLFFPWFLKVNQFKNPNFMSLFYQQTVDNFWIIKENVQWNI